MDFSDWGYCFIDFKNHKQAALAKRIGIRDLFEGKEKVVFMIFCGGAIDHLGDT